MPVLEVDAEVGMSFHDKYQPRLYYLVDLPFLEETAVLYVTVDDEDGLIICRDTSLLRQQFFGIDAVH